MDSHTDGEARVHSGSACCPRTLSHGLWNVILCVKLPRRENLVEDGDVFVF